jgi:hypothetical protein
VIFKIWGWRPRICKFLGSLEQFSENIVLNIEWSLRFEAEGREFAEILGSLEQFSEKIVLNIEWSLGFEAEGREFAEFLGSLEVLKVIKAYVKRISAL